MTDMPPFAEVLEAVGKLSLDEQETLVDILNRRVVDQRRARLAQDIRDAQDEFRRGECRPATPDDLMRDILS